MVVGQRAASSRRLIEKRRPAARAREASQRFTGLRSTGDSTLDSPGFGCFNASVSRKSAPVIQPVGRGRFAGGLPTPRPPGCVMSTIRKRARVIDEVYGPGFHYRTPLSPQGHTCAYPHPGPYPAISPRTWHRESVRSRERLATEGERTLQESSPKRVTVRRTMWAAAICAPPWPHKERLTFAG
jgi:hypothetical protein